MASGVPARRVAEQAGVHSSVVGFLLYGRGERPPTVKLRPTTATAILAVTAGSVLPTPRQLVDATGTRRRIHALIAAGWSITAQAQDLDRDPRNHEQSIRRTWVTVRLATLVAEQYERLWDQRSPDGIGRSRALASARKYGYAPPMAWLGVDIDDPKAEPDFGDSVDTEPDHVLVAHVVTAVARKPEKDEYRPELRLELIEREVDRVAVVAELARRGLTPTVIASRLTARPSTVRKLLGVAA
jgi:hypothetical protein